MVERRNLVIECSRCHRPYAQHISCQPVDVYRVALEKIRDCTTGPLAHWKSPETMQEAVHAYAAEALDAVAGR